MDSLKREFNYSETEDIAIYPTPTINTITILADDFMYNKIKALYLIDLAGKEIELNKERTINIENRANGTYLLKIKILDETCIYKKIIKQ